MFCDAKKQRSRCPVTFALDRFGDKWSLLIVRDLMFRDKNTYGEFLNSGDGIATNVLADRLKSLEAEGIISKSRDPDNRRKYIYKLTEKGLDLIPVLLEMMRWSIKHDPNPVVSYDDFIKQLEADREQLVACLRKSNQT